MAKHDFPRLLIADKDHRIYDVPGLEAAGMKGGRFFRLDKRDLIKLPPDSELFMLPDRYPVGFDPVAGQYTRVQTNPFDEKNRPCYPVAAFICPGYTANFNPAYKESRSACLLPLFSYAAAAYYKGQVYAAGTRVDMERRQQLKGMDLQLVARNVKKFRKYFPGNRLVRHLETCALQYGCPAGRNFFLQRYECPLPTSPSCNSSCLGCISHQPENGCPATQERIKFVPAPEEIAEVALFHMREVKDPVVSFGQGCEGEPLMSGETIIKAVKIIRRATGKGVINMNTNASKPGIIERLFKAGMDSMRVSLNSVREEFYDKYYRPAGYSFSDVLSSIKKAKKSGGFISINYLVVPGFTDLVPEVDSLYVFLRRYGIDMIQWRNLNYDPAAYFKKMRIHPDENEMIGIDTLIASLKKGFPRLMHGYFNPSRGRIRRFRGRPGF